MRGLKICLWIAGILCLLSIFGIFLPVSAWESILRFFGHKSLDFPSSALMEYTIRVGSATYVAIGVYLIILALRPMKYPVLIPFTGLAAIFIGVVCGVTGLIAAMAPLWYLGDTLGCLVLGTLILLFWQKAKTGRTIED